ncbi:MAG: YdcF family protein [Clostridium sp.]
MGKERRGLMGKIFIVLGIICISYYLILITAAGAISFSYIWIIIGITAIGFGLDRLNPSKSIIDKIPIGLQKYLLIIALIGIVFFSALEALIIYNGVTSDNEKPDYVIILGAGLRGSQMSTTLINRMEEGVEYIVDNPDIKVVVSGGKGEDEDITEASAMKKYLLDNGIKEDMIIVEDKSTSTFENFKFSYEKLSTMDKRENIKLTVITNGFHMFRAKMLGERCGFEVYRQPAPGYKPLDPNFYLREVFGVIKSYMFDR